MASKGVRAIYFILYDIMLDFYAIRILNQSPRRSNFGREVAPHGFLLRSSEKSRREVAPQDIHFRSNSAPRHSEKNWQRGRATSFPFWIEIRESAVLDWGCATFTLQKECHVVFFPIKGIPREHSRENSQIATTQLRHPSLLLWWDEGITRAVVTKRWGSWRVCIQNEDVHIARNF